MKQSLLLVVIVILASTMLQAQNVFDPNDPQIRYSSSQPVGSLQNPDPTLKGLQKWVSTPSNGISTGSGAWDNSSYKAYFLNLVSSTGVFNQMPYRIKFPKSWNNPDSAGKKYPIAVFFHGAGEFGCPTNNGLFNNEKQLVHGGKTFRDRVDNNLFDGFLVYPQNYNPDGCWGEWPSKVNAKYVNVISMIDSLAKYAKADIDRVFTFGLSSGGVASWTFAINYPTRVARIAPSSGLAPSATTNYLPFVHIPVWLATGGKDIAPSPGSAQNQVNKVKAVGGDIRYTLYPDLGHAVWNTHWAEPDFVPYMNGTHKANPLIFFQRDAFCPEDTFSVKLGITAGYYSYEWQKDGVLIARQVGTTRTILDGSSIVLFEGNNITVKSFGTYRVRFKRSSSSSVPFSEWSPIPAVIKPKPITQTPPIVIDGLRSKVLPAPDGSTTVPLKLADNYYGYQWYRATDNGVVASVQKFNAAPGTYRGKVFEQFGCGTAYSPDFKVIASSGLPKPDAAKNLTAFGLSKTSVQLDWSKNPNAGTPETGFEIYRSSKPGGPYTLIRITNPNVITYVDDNLPSNTQYYYIVRAVNDFGAAAVSNEAGAKTVNDNIPPTAPSGLLYRGSTTASVDLQWNASSDDVGVVRYDVYGNNTKLFSTKNTYATIFGIDSLKSYTFFVKAIDAAGNQSPASNQVIAYTHKQGLNYKYYTGTWSNLPNFNSLTPLKTGITDTVNTGSNIRTQSDRYGFLWEGFIYIPVAGSYTFETYSDDGSKLYIDVPYSSNATAVVDNDGSHSARYRSGIINLSEGYHSIAITFFEATGGEEMQVLWTCTSAGINRERIPRNYFSVSAGPSINPSSVPGSLTAQGTGYDRISLSWSDVNNETGYELVRSTSVNGNYIPVGSVGQDVTTFIDSNLQASTTYYYKLRSVSVSGNSAFTPAVNAATASLPAPPTAPGQPALNVLGSSAIAVTFDDNSNDETGFELWRSMGDQNNFRKVTVLGASNNAQVLFNDNGLFANVTYYYKVRATGKGDPSDFSSVSSATTLNTDPQLAGVEDFSMKYGTTFSVILKGSDPDSDPLTYNGVSLPAFASIQSNPDGTGTIVFNPSNADQGTYPITVNVTDGKATASTSFTLTVNSNGVPVISTVADVYMNEGDQQTITLTATDAESVNSLTWQFQNLPSFATFANNGNGTGSLLVKPGYANNGVYTVTVKVLDPNGAWATIPVNITVYEKDPNETVQINFRNFTGGVPAWNDIQLQQTANASPPEPYFDVSNLKNTVGNNTGMRINVVSGIYKASQNGQVTGLDIGVYPDNVLRDQMNWGWGVGTNDQDTVVLRVSGLSGLRKYNFTFFGSYLTGSTSSKTTYMIGTLSTSVLYYLNTTATGTISNIAPNANGEVFIKMIGDASTSRGGVLNALVVSGLYQDGTLPAKPADLTAKVVPNAGVQLNWTDKAYNETSYKVYRATAPGGPWTFINTVGTFRDSTAYLDQSVAAYTTYYYYVAGINSYGQGVSSDIVSVVTGNIPPVITGLSNLFVKTDGSADRNFTVKDSPGDIITVKADNLPSFVTFADLGSGNYRLSANPTADNIGQTPVIVAVSDDKGGFRTQTIVVNVADKFTRSVFVNLGSLGKTAPLPWNNWLGARSASSKLSALKDENGVSTPFVITSLTKWAALTDMGMMTGFNTGVYPDSVLASGVLNITTTPMQFRFTGLNAAKKYNISVLSSMNEGVDATSQFNAGSEYDTLNASYNTNRTANMNGLVPDGTGGITVTITKIGTAYGSYVNGIVLEEYDPVITLMNPANLYAEPVNRNSIALSWSDRSGNENAADGFQLQRATDSLFTQNVTTFTIAGNKRNFTNTGLSPNTRYWYRLRAKSGADYSEYSNRAKAVTPQSIVYVNFNYQLPDAAAPWNNLSAVPNVPDIFPNLTNQSGTNTGIQLSIERAFNGEFTAGKNTGNNSGVVPDAVLASNFWIDNTQQSTIRISGLNQGKRYRFGFVGSSSANGWYKADYTATYSISDKTVYLNSWENASKMVFIPDVVADENGEVLITLSTTKAAAYGFNAGISISSYDDPNGGPVTSGTKKLEVAPARGVAVEAVDRTTANVNAKAYPNPFVDMVNIDFFNSSSANRVSLELYDVTGKLAIRRQFSNMAAGFNTIRLNTRETAMGAGLYIVNLSINGKPIKTTKMVKTNK